MWIFEDGEKKLLASGAVKCINSKEIAIGNKRYINRTYQIRALNSEDDGFTEAVLTKKARLASLETKKKKERPETSKGSSQRTFFDKVLPWRWFG